MKRFTLIILFQHLLMALACARADHAEPLGRLHACTSQTWLAMCICQTWGINFLTTPPHTCCRSPMEQKAQCLSMLPEVSGMLALIIEAGWNPRPASFDEQC